MTDRGAATVSAEQVQYDIARLGGILLIIGMRETAGHRDGASWQPSAD